MERAAINFCIPYFWCSYSETFTNFTDQTGFYGPCGLGRRDHRFIAVHAGDVHHARGADAHTAAGADVLAGAAGLFGELGDGRAAVGASAADHETAELIAIDQDVSIVFPELLK